MKPSHDHLQTVKTRWGIGDQLQFVRKVENWIYKANSEHLFVRMTEPVHRTPPQIFSELDWMNHLEKAGVKFAHPVESKHGNLVEQVGSDGHLYSVVVFKEATGVRLIEPQDFTRERMRSWGKTIGQMHLATRSYSPSDEVEMRPHWNTERNYHCVHKHRSDRDGALFNRYDALLDQLKKLSQNNTVYGLIHADVHHGNFFVSDDDQITVFDFDDCHYHWFAYDLAVPLFGIDLTLKMKNSSIGMKDIVGSFCEGYLSVNREGAKIIESVPLFVEYRDFIIHYWCRENLENDELGEGPRDWMLTVQDLSSASILTGDYERFKSR